jgi:hypothetical protein
MKAGQSKMHLVALACLAATLVACEQKAATSATSTASVPAVATNPASHPAKPTYAGTYTVQDTAVCAVSITIIEQAGGYRFEAGNAHGQVQVIRQETDTYLVFKGLKGGDPADDVEAAWQDSMLVIQNYGNSMNQYLRFAQCDAKYLELLRQR